MPDLKQFRLPDVGEGLTEAEIVSWKVKPGDTIEINDIVVEIETAKSLVELPSPYAGTIEALLVPEGETVAVGTPIIRIGSADDAAPAGGSPAADAHEPIDTNVPPAEGQNNTLVGYGPRETVAQRRRILTRESCRSPSRSSGVPMSANRHCSTGWPAGRRRWSMICRGSRATAARATGISPISNSA